MKSGLSIKYHIGESLPHKWSSVYNYKPQTDEIFTRKGEIFAVFSLNAPKSFNSTTAGNLLVDHFHEQYFESRKDSVILSLETAITAVGERLAELLTNEEEVAESGVDLNVTALVIRGDEIYFASMGNGRVLVLPDTRLDRYIDITNSLRDQYGKGIVKVGSTFLQPDQRFLISTETTVEDLGQEEVLASLKSFSDLRLKNYEFENSEEVACFLIGYELNQTLDEEASTAGIINRLENSPEETIPAEPKLSPDSDSLDGEMPKPDFKDSEFSDPAFSDPGPLEHGGELDGEQGESESSDLGPLESESTDEELSPFAKFVQTARQKFTEFKKNREIGKLQAARTSGESTANLDRGLAGGRTSERNGADPAVDMENMNTAQALLTRARLKFMGLKDIFLYDILKINQRSGFEFGKDAAGKYYLGVFGIHLNQNLLMVVGVLILVFVAYSVISSIGAQRERANQLVAARDTLTLIREDISGLESSPVLNSRSTGDTPQRTQLLNEIDEVESKFSSDLEVLPEDDVNAQRERLASLREQVLRVKRPELSLVLDVASEFSGGVVNFTRSGENLYVLDRDNGKIYRQPVNGSTPEEAVTGLDSPQALVADSDGNLVVYNAGADNVIAIASPVTRDFRAIPGISFERMPNVRRMAIYDVTNAIYTVAQEDNKVEQSNRVGNSYALPNTRYQEQDGSVINDVQIVQRQVFALVAGKGITRVGSESSRFEGFDEVVSAANNGRLFGFDEEYLYILDSEQNRLLVFTINRGGQPISDFVAQVDLSAVSGTINQVVVDQQRNLVFVSDSSKIYSFSRADVLN